MGSIGIPELKADLFLIHPPAYLDFRGCRDVYFPFLDTSGAVPVTPLYDYFPLGFKSLRRYLTGFGHEVKIINLCTLLLSFPEIDLREILAALDARLIGISLHWMVHVQGSLEIARLIKQIHPATPVIFGGISSTYYADELIQYPFVDLVMRGYDTHLAMGYLIDAIKQGSDYNVVPNLLWKSADGTIHTNEFNSTTRTYGYGVDWTDHPEPFPSQKLPFLEILTNMHAGCTYNCGWCGGSRDAFRRINQSSYPLARKSETEVAYEFQALYTTNQASQYHMYSANTYNESGERLDGFLSHIEQSNLRSVNYEQYYLTPDHVLKKMARANQRTTITLSPESHDLRISKLAGRGVYANDELERWLEKAFEIGISQVDIWYFVGMPEQDEISVMETVDYCQHLLEKFKGQRVIPMICPMIPILDPGSTFFEDPSRYGYRVFFRTLEEHRRAMERASIINRINYETKWLSREDLVYVGFKAVKRLMETKAAVGLLPVPWMVEFNTAIDDALDFIRVVHKVDCITDEIDRSLELSKLGNEISRRNEKVFFSGVLNQAFPIYREIGGRWFDELGWEWSELNEMIENRGEEV